ncbi:MAG: PD-(D/E)XK nuclease family protein [Patescibacteria group bacterium]|nr:PD-(D/E)XK nuclease family protein [Patescibacteria group bacterium]
MNSNNMNPLPLVDGCLLIDNSSLEKLSCPRRWQYSEIDLRSPVAERAGANFGSTMHRGWETRFKLCGTTAPNTAQTVLIESAMADWLAEHPQPAGDFRDLNHACRVMRVYNHVYPQENFTILKNHVGEPIIEASFMLPFALYNPSTGDIFSWTQDHDKVQELIASYIPIYYCGKLDLGISDSNGLWSFDHKTAFQFGDSWNKQMSMDGGQLGYCWALKQVTGQQVAGYIIDGVRIRRPSVKAQFTGESPVDATDFVRLPNFVTPDQLDEWREDVMCIIRDIIQCHQRNFFPRHRWQCVGKYGPCDFFDVCSTPRAQRQVVLQSGLFETNEWSKGLKVMKG